MKCTFMYSDSVCAFEAAVYTMIILSAPFASMSFPFGNVLQPPQHDLLTMIIPSTSTRKLRKKKKQRVTSRSKDYHASQVLIQHSIDAGNTSSVLGDPKPNDHGATVILGGNLTEYPTTEDCQQNFQAIQACNVEATPGFVPSGCASGRINYHHCGDDDLRGSLFDWNLPAYFLGPYQCPEDSVRFRGGTGR